MQLQRPEELMSLTSEDIKFLLVYVSQLYLFATLRVKQGLMRILCSYPIRQAGYHLIKGTASHNRSWLVPFGLGPSNACPGGLALFANCCQGSKSC